MTLKDLLKRTSKNDYDKVIIFDDGKGWTNVWFEITDTTIKIIPSSNEIFSDDK